MLTETDIMKIHAEIDQLSGLKNKPLERQVPSEMIKKMAQQIKKAVTAQSRVGEGDTDPFSTQ